MPRPEKHVFICLHSRPEGHPKGSCQTRDSGEVIQEFSRIFDEQGLFGRFRMTSCGCLGPCQMGPNLVVYPEGVMYCGVRKDDVATIVQEHLLGGKPVERLLAPAELWS